MVTVNLSHIAPSPSTRLTYQQNKRMYVCPCCRIGACLWSRVVPVVSHVISRNMFPEYKHANHGWCPLISSM